MIDKTNEIPETTSDQLKILVVDDRPENIFALVKILEPLEVEIYTAESGMEALSLILRHAFVLVLLDVQMPEMDGFETATLIREQDEIPIIFVTAISKEEQYVFEGYEHGAVDYLFKPVNPDIMKSKVKIFLQLAKQRQTLRNLVSELEVANETILAQQESVLEEERLKMLLQMTGATAHDLNQPLTVIQARIEQIVRDIDKPEALKKQIESLSEASIRIGKMVKRIQLVQQGEFVPSFGINPTISMGIPSSTRVLCVEDSDEDFALLDESLSAIQQIDRVRVRSIGQVKQAVEESKYDLIFVNYNLPDGTALDFLMNALTIDMDVPVVVISGQDDSMVASRLIQAGAYDYLSKQYLNETSLRRAISNTLDKARLRRDVLEAQRMTAELSTQDGLTGLFNKRYFTESLDREMARETRHNDGLVLCMLDLDHFKQVNDTYGHIAGISSLVRLPRYRKTYFARPTLYADTVVKNSSQY
ncbi:response regulator [bacterium AH-315-P07]|nr:response regulator [bacterium AH-315-P07]